MLAWTCLMLVAVVAIPGAAAGQDAARVLVVMNRSDPASLELGQYYASKRGIPTSQLVALDVPAAESISRAEYERRIEGPIATWLRSQSAQDRIHYLVLIKGLPLRIDGTGGRMGSSASVDSELTLLYRRMVGRLVPLAGPVKNPYFADPSANAAVAPFARDVLDIYLVTRLDGFTADDVRALIDRSVAARTPPAEAVVMLDQRGGGELPDKWLREAAGRLTALPGAPRVTLETTGAAASGGELVGYYSWGSTDAALRTRALGVRFVPGAIGGRFLSTDARTFREPAEGWSPGDWEDRTRFFAETPEGLAGDLIREGITGMSASVTEPYLDAAIRPEVLFTAYASGRNLAEAFYAAAPSLSWQAVVIGDPLCRPFARPGTAEATTSDAIDPATEMPVVFAERRIEAIWQRDVPKATLQSLLKAEARLQRGDRDGARAVLESLAEDAAPLPQAVLLLASLYEQAGEFERAEDAYRRVLAAQPHDIVSLNNLAYSLSVRRGKPKDALPLAQQAFKLSRGDALVGDTLGWIHHLLGDDKAARPYLIEAARLQPDSPDVRLHVAVVLAALGEASDAERHLAAAVRLAPAFDERDDVKALRSRLGTPGTPRR